MPTTLVELKHGYDQASNRLYRRDEVARANSASFDELYSYDGLHRLTSFDRGQLNGTNNGLSSGPTISQDWTLDPLGNWNRFQQGVVGTLDQTREHNEVNEIIDIDKTVGADWPTPDYEANGNMVTFPNPHDLTSQVGATYDAWNRLVKLDDSVTLSKYEYDGLNRRIIKEVNSVVRHYYHSDQWQVLEERIDSNATADRQYVWGQRYVDDLILRDHDSTRLYALTDALYNVVALTDDTGDVKERFAYQPYGESTELDPDFASDSGIDYEWEYRFTGRELDLESGLQLNRNRYLHHQLGRWITRDPIEQLNSDVPFYSYASDIPTRNVDPLGLWDQLILFPPTWQNALEPRPPQPPPPPPRDCCWKALPAPDDKPVCTLVDQKVCRVVQSVPTPGPSPVVSIIIGTPSAAMPKEVCDIPLNNAANLYGSRCRCIYRESQLCQKAGKDCTAAELKEERVVNGAYCGITYGKLAAALWNGPGKPPSTGFIGFGNNNVGCDCPTPKATSGNLCQS